MKSVSKQGVRHFPFAKIVYVADADTVDIEVDQGFGNKVTARFRLADVNAAERFTPLGIQAKAFVATFIGTPIVVDVAKLDKYGRYLVVIYLKDGVCLNDALVEQGFAVPYMVGQY